KEYVYTVAQEGDQGGVNAYKVHPETYALERTSSQLEEGAPPCYVESTGNVLTAANYHKGSVGMFHVGENGKIAEGSFVTHDETGQHQREEKSLHHHAGEYPCKNYILAGDVGGDVVITYRPMEKGLEHVATLKVEEGIGPRHLTFHADGDDA